MIATINPLNGQLLKEYQILDDVQLNQTLHESKNAYLDWREQSFDTRADLLNKVADELIKLKPELTECMAKEMGKPVREGGPEVEKGALCARHYAANAEQYLASTSIESDASESYVCYQPLGPVLGILPWNAPTWLAFRFLAPALMAGNSCLLKGDPLVCGTTELIMQAFKNAGAPEHLVSNLRLPNKSVAGVIQDPRVVAVSFTGSSATGAKVAATASSVIKPCVLELGGSDPCVVLADADLEQAANIACLSRIINAGQSCIAAKRVIVEDSVYDNFCTMLAAKLKALKVGDPLDENTNVGPLARKDIQQNLHRQVQESIRQGAHCMLGGELPDGPGWFYPVTLLTDVSENMTVYQEETFGPVMSVSRAENAAQALDMANNTHYGLGAAIWTGSQEMAAHFVTYLEAGQVAVNGIVKTDPRLPSGGIKCSGFGRELGPHGIKEFVNCKQVWIA
ncbi:NAD-dependent succinate-semialdehyde dehydrogenase [Gayadomonas joobiniege]|uniref:NAD-dependent succinate-semialdehyde dehydrogenase n=1 Tax=Gayadomonas joobiniege TaxID=1234606 RepID=UPI00036D45B6|nr:NAD-dependent succinate-semialdehyde dehydrogenase [Gayadomonas joobiniege]